MADIQWKIRGPEIASFNCAYGCPCQFNAPPTNGDCRAAVAMQIEQGHFGDVKLDGLRWAAVAAWPGPIHEGNGAMPWAGVDPIVTSAQVVTGLQTIVSRQLNITQEPAVLTIGAINGGNRSNIVPDSVQMLGSLRTFDEGMRTEAKQRITQTAQSIAAASGARR